VRPDQHIAFHGPIRAAIDTLIGLTGQR